MYIEEDVSHSFCRNYELVGEYGSSGFYQLWSSRRQRDMSKPHIGVAVCDSERSSVATLASEVAAAITVLKYRYRRGDFVNFHTIPVSSVSILTCVFFHPRLEHGRTNGQQVIVYSFHHDESARITQAYWDDGGLVIRHSRLLDLRGDEPTRDAYLLIKWLANKPVGETAYQVPQESNPVGNGEKPRPDCATRWDISVGA